MTTIQSYLAISGNDTNNNDLRDALTTEGFVLTKDISVAAASIDPTLGANLRDTHQVPRGIVNQFISAANTRQAQIQSQQAQATQVVRRNESLNSQENDRVKNLEDKMKDFDDKIDKIKKDGRTTRELMGIYRLDASKTYSTYTQAFDVITVGVFASIMALIIRAGVVAPDDGRCFILVGLGILNVILLYLIKTSVDVADRQLWNRVRGSFLSLASGLASFFEIGVINDGLVFTILCYVIAGLLPFIDIYFKVKIINQLRKAHRILMSQLESKMREGFEHEKSVKAVKKSSKESSHHSLAAPSHGSSDQKLDRNKSDPSLLSANGSNVVTIPLAPVNE